jgi:PIN domain nuclease of toxin-antitoxin system
MWWFGSPVTPTNSPGEQPKRSRAARGEGGLAISDISLFELASLADRNRIQLHLPMVSFLEEVQSRFIILPINSKIAAQAVQLPAPYPRDPMDRIIGATAQVHGLSLVTADNGIRQSKTVKTIW